MKKTKRRPAHEYSEDALIESAAIALFWDTLVWQMADCFEEDGERAKYCDAVYQHLFDTYADATHNVYAQAS